MSGRGKKLGKLTTCFLAAPSTVDLQPLRATLSKKGIRSIEASELIQTGAPLIDHIKAAISKSDLVIAVLDVAQSNANIYFEIGLASAFGKQILLVAPPDLKIPSDTRSLFRVMATPDNTEAISFVLDQAMAGRPRESSKFKNVEKTRPIGHSSTHLIHTLDSLGELPKEIELIAIIADALKSSGVRVVVSSKIAGVRPDLAVWTDELGPLVGNPFVIEVKRTLRDRESVNEAIAQVSRYLSVIDATWALVLYGGPVSVNLKREADFRGTNVLFMNVRDFLDALGTRSFAQIIQDLRNQAVHGN